MIPHRMAILTTSAFLLGALSPFATAQPAQLSIQLDKPLHPVSPMLYGLMTEEINYSYDGGLYAEMVRNRTFQDHGFGGLAHWNLDNKGTARGTISFDPTEGPSSALPGSMLFNITSADGTNTAGVHNEGYWGMALKPDTTYKGSLYAKADSDNFGPLTVSFVNDNSGETLATASIGNATTSWKHYDFTLKTGNLTPSSTNHLLISAVHAGKLWLNLISVFPPTYKNRENGNRPDIMELLAGMHPKFLRLPGGNYLEGNQIDERFDWKTTIGPLVDRPTHRSPGTTNPATEWGYLNFLSGPKTSTSNQCSSSSPDTPSRATISIPALRSRRLSMTPLMRSSLSSATLPPNGEPCAPN